MVSEKILNIAEANMNSRFVDNPCRGIVVGMDAASNIVQLYWIMGRSDSSRNRVFKSEDLSEFSYPGLDDFEWFGKSPFVETDLAKPTAKVDPLTIYTAMEQVGDICVVSNGDQTDSIVDSLIGGSGFYQAMLARTREPDNPNYTARISALQRMGRKYKDVAFISVVKRDLVNPAGRPFRFTYELPMHPEIGYCVTTYAEGDRAGLNPFSGEPFVVPIGPKPIAGCDLTLMELVRGFWNKLDSKNPDDGSFDKVSIAGRIIRPDGSCDMHIINRYQKIA